MVCDEGSGTGLDGELMDLMSRLLRLREGVCVVFEVEKVVMDDWVWFHKYVKPRILERGVKVDGAGLSIDGAVDIKERSQVTVNCQGVDSDIEYNDSVLSTV